MRMKSMMIWCNNSKRATSEAHKFSFTAQQSKNKKSKKSNKPRSKKEKKKSFLLANSSTFNRPSTPFH
jgi:hypothetical protein